MLIFQGVNMFFNEMIILSLSAESFNQTDSPHCSQNSSLTMAKVRYPTGNTCHQNMFIFRSHKYRKSGFIVEYPTILTCFFRSYNSANGKLFAWGPGGLDSWDPLIHERDCYL